MIRSDWGGNERFCNEGDNNDGDRIGLPTKYQFWFKDKSNHGIWIYPLRYSREMRRWKSIPKRREAWKAVFGGCQDHWRSRAPIKDWSLTLHQTIPKDDRKHFSCPPYTYLNINNVFNITLSKDSMNCYVENMEEGSQNVYPISMHRMAEPKRDPGQYVSNLLDLSECQKQLGVRGGGHWCPDWAPV